MSEKLFERDGLRYVLSSCGIPANPDAQLEAKETALVRNETSHPVVDAEYTRDIDELARQLLR